MYCIIDVLYFTGGYEASFQDYIHRQTQDLKSEGSRLRRRIPAEYGLNLQDADMQCVPDLTLVIKSFY